jgi:hypothetical protein
MEMNLTTLNALELLVKEHKKKSMGLYQTNITKKLISSNCDAILQMIDELKDMEKEQSRLDWKAGYLYCSLDVSEWLGNEKDDSFLTEGDMEVIEFLSFEYINNKK